VSSPSHTLATAPARDAVHVKGWELGVGVFIAGFCVFLQLYATQPLLSLLRRAFSSSEGEVTLTVSAATLAVAVASPFVGSLGDALGRKRVIVPCLASIAFATLLCGTARSLPALIAWRFVGGVFTPGVIAVTLAYISEESPAGTAAWTTSLYVTGTVLGGLTGRLVSAFVADSVSWRGAFVSLAILTMLGALATAWLLPRSTRFVRQTDWHESARSLRQHLRNPQLLATYFVGYSVLFCHVGLFTYASFRLASPPFSLSTSALGSVFLVYALGLFVTPAAGKMVDVIGHRAGTSIAAITVVLGALLTLVPGLTTFVVGLAVASSGVFVAQASASSHVGSSAEDARSAASGLYVASYYFGGSCGATALVVPWRYGGWTAVVACIAAVQAAVLFVAQRYFDPKVAAP
jgi:predicted MFS family arabinose efflux permease